MSNMFDQGTGSDLHDQFRQDYEYQQNQQQQLQQKKRSRMTWLVGTIGAVLIIFMMLGISACGTYNSLTGQRENVRREFSNIDVQLQRRADLIPNLVNTVKGYATHEEKVFSEIAQAR